MCNVLLSRHKTVGLQNICVSANQHNNICVAKSEFNDMAHIPMADGRISGLPVTIEPDMSMYVSVLVSELVGTELGICEHFHSIHYYVWVWFRLQACARR